MADGVVRPSFISCCCRRRLTRASASRTSISGIACCAASQLRAGQRHGRLQRRVVQPRQHLALAHGHAFLDVHLDDLAGDLRRHRGAPPRGDVARGVQDRGLGAGGPFGDGDHLDLDRAVRGSASTRRRHRRRPAASSNTTHFTQRPPPVFRGSRSMRRADKSSIESVTVRLPSETSNGMRTKGEEQPVLHDYLPNDVESGWGSSTDSGRAGELPGRPAESGLWRVRRVARSL